VANGKQESNSPYYKPDWLDRLFAQFMANSGLSATSSSPEQFSCSQEFFERALARALRLLPKLTFEALLIWSVETKGEQWMTDRQMIELHDRFESSASRWGWPADTDDPVDALGDICYLISRESKILIAALYENVRLQESGQRFMVSRTIRQQAYDDLSSEVSAWFSNRSASGEHSRGDRQRQASSTSRRSDSGAFELLGVDRNATLAEIKKAYHLKIALWHPDKLEGMAPELKQIANERLAQINAAYECLCKQKRASKA
jgi:DnaJ-domain-containing protein 1